MPTYSHSKISTFDQCKYKYKLQYIDKVEVDIPNTIEAFMGGIVHKALEKLHQEHKNGVTKLILFDFYRKCWEEEYDPKIIVPRKMLTAEDYKKMGMIFIRDYYDSHPFSEDLQIIALETQDTITLPDGSQWHVRIDKLACDKQGNYYVCDYKTSKTMKVQEEADKDRQLAMYSIWVRDKFKEAKSVKLVWHMLAFKDEVISERTDEQLKALQEEIVGKIKEIENAKEFPANVSPLCNWCIYKDICPFFKEQGWARQKKLF